MRVALCVVLACLCGTTRVAISQGPTSGGLRQLEPVRIQDTDSLFVARPLQMVLGPRGHLFLTEGRETRVLDIGPTGRIERVFGRKGRGPGEFESPTAMAAAGDTILAVYDHSVKRVTFVDIPGWKLRRVSPLLIQRPPEIRFVGNDLMVTMWDFGSNTSLAKVAEETGALEERQGVIPSLGAQTQLLITGAFWNGTFAPVGDEFFAMYEVSSSLYRWKRGAREAREIPIPVMRRRGIPAGLFELLLRDPAKATPALVFDRSVPVAIAQVSSDIVAIVTMDVKVEGEMWSGVHHVTLYDHRRDRLCVDLPVPASRTRITMGRDPLPHVAVRGDTLALLEQAESPAGDPIHLLRRYRIEPALCAWSALSR